MMLMMPDLQKKGSAHFLQIHNDSGCKYAPVEDLGHNEGHVGAREDEEGFGMAGVLCLGCKETDQNPAQHS